MTTHTAPGLIATTAADHGWVAVAATPSSATYTRGDREVTVVFDANGDHTSWTLLRSGVETKSSEYLYKLLDLLAARP